MAPDGVQAEFGKNQYVHSARRKRGFSKCTHKGERVPPARGGVVGKGMKVARIDPEGKATEAKQEKKSPKVKSRHPRGNRPGGLLRKGAATSLGRENVRTEAQSGED